MIQETETKLTQWLSMYPESEHPLDMERFYDMVCSIVTNEESLDEFGNSNLLHYLEQCQPKWEKKVKDSFAEEWEIKIELCVNLLKFYLKKYE